MIENFKHNNKKGEANFLLAIMKVFFFWKKFILHRFAIMNNKHKK